MSSEIEMKVYGRVQGVNLRRSVWKEANKLGLKGYVLNRIDGSVEVVAQGEKKSVQALLDWVQKSPGFSSVRGLHYQWRSPSSTFSHFELIRDNSFIVDQAKSFLNLGRSLVKKKTKSFPLHVSIIPDGNRRWARKKGAEAQMGHYSAASFQHMNELFEEAQKGGVKYLTIWGFSTENWKRNAIEVNAIFDLIVRWAVQFKEDALDRKIRFRHIGRKDRLPPKVLNALEELESETKDYHDFHLQLCLDYGGSDELVRAINSIIRKGISSIDEKILFEHLDSKDIPPVDLIIRTSGEQRLSGFMPLQSAYAELYFSPVHFPDFDAKEFRKALKVYEERQRRFGS